jgi:hypothetical protein
MLVSKFAHFKKQDLTFNLEQRKYKLINYASARLLLYACLVSMGHIRIPDPR